MRKTIAEKRGRRRRHKNSEQVQNMDKYRERKWMIS